MSASAEPAASDGPAARPVGDRYWWGGRVFARQACLDSVGGDPARQAEIRDVTAAQAAVILDMIARTGYRVAPTGAALGRTLPGMVTEGANAMNVGGDPVLRPVFDAGLPCAKRYADDVGAWATNEPRLYANANFAAVAARFARA